MAAVLPDLAGVPVAPASTVAPAPPAAGGLAVLARATTPRQGWLAVIGVAALVGLLYAGRPFFIALTASLMLAALLEPVRAQLVRVLRSSVLASLVAVVGVLVLTGALAWGVAAQLSATSDRMPTVLKLAARDIAALAAHGGPSTLRQAQVALNELDRSVAKVTGAEASRLPRPTPQASLVTEAAEWLRLQFMAGTWATVSVLVQVGVIALLTFFLMCSGEAAVRRVCAWAAQRQPRDMVRTRQALYEMAHQTRVYLGVLTVSNIVLGIGVGLGLWAFGVPEPASWGLAAAALHFVPYAGMAIVMALAGVEVYAVHASVGVALLAALYVAVLGTVVGTAMTTWLQGRAARVDSALLFGGTVFWATLWGGWGLVLGAALVVALRVALLAAARARRANQQRQVSRAAV